ncbi:MAG: HEPN domain-containing protein, partial [Chloroflexota bacterium]
VVTVSLKLKAERDGKTWYNWFTATLKCMVEGQVLDIVAPLNREKLNTILHELRRQLEALYGPRLAQLVLYGSQARGDPEPGSDIDVLVVLEGPVDPGEEIERTGELVAGLSLKHNVVISRVFLEREQAATEWSPFLVNVRREGVVFDKVGDFSQGIRRPTTTSTETLTGVPMMSQQVDLLKKAAESFNAAELLSEQGYDDFAASRAYYAMFYVAQAFLLGEGLTPSKHSTVISAFGERFAKSNRLPIKFHRYLIDAQDQRLTADYKTGAHLTKTVVEEMINHAKEFLELGDRLSGSKHK